jgi:hypothetical protein
LGDRVEAINLDLEKGFNLDIEWILKIRFDGSLKVIFAESFPAIAEIESLPVPSAYAAGEGERILSKLYLARTVFGVDFATIKYPGLEQVAVRYRASNAWQSAKVGCGTKSNSHVVPITRADGQFNPRCEPVAAR